MQEIRIQPFRNYLIRAKWIFPVISSPIFDGAVEIKGGRITRVDKFKILKKEKTHAEFLDLEEIILLPCLVNVHTHLELSALRFKILPLKIRRDAPIIITNIISEIRTSMSVIPLFSSKISIKIPLFNLPFPFPSNQKFNSVKILFFFMKFCYVRKLWIITEFPFNKWW